MGFLVVIPAAGDGLRLGAEIPKAFVKLKGTRYSKEILQRTVELFHSIEECSAIVVAAPERYLNQCRDLLTTFRKVQVIVGGATRQASVSLGLQSLSDKFSGETPTLIHDAARCLVSEDVIKRVYLKVRSGVGVVCAVSVVDALVTTRGSSLDSYLSRENVLAIQTPQGFILNEILSVHLDYQNKTDRGLPPVDDASLYIQVGKVEIVEGSKVNIKITYPADIVFAEVVLQQCSETHKGL